jgi:fatty acid-binding protein DegV
MSRVTLSKHKENLIYESKEIEKLLDRGQNTQQNIQRLEQIEEQLRIIATMEKPDSMAKKAKMEG